MDVLKRVLLLAFYVGIVAVGIMGFLALQSVRDAPRQLKVPPAEVQQTVADTLSPEQLAD